MAKRIPFALQPIEFRHFIVPLNIHPLKPQFVQIQNEEICDNTSKRKRPNTTNETRQAILIFLSQRHKNGRLVKGATEEAMIKFEKSAEKILRTWQRGQNGVLDPQHSCDVSSKKNLNCSWKKKWDRKICKPWPLFNYAIGKRYIDFASVFGWQKHPFGDCCRTET